MPLPTAAELTDPNATNTQMKQRLGQLAENVLSKDDLVDIERFLDYKLSLDEYVAGLVINSDLTVSSASEDYRAYYFACKSGDLFSYTGRMGSSSNGKTDPYIVQLDSQKQPLEILAEYKSVGNPDDYGTLTAKCTHDGFVYIRLRTGLDEAHFPYVITRRTNNNFVEKSEYEDTVDSLKLANREITEIELNVEKKASSLDVKTNEPVSIAITFMDGHRTWLEVGPDGKPSAHSEGILRDLLGSTPSGVSVQHHVPMFRRMSTPLIEYHQQSADTMYWTWAINKAEWGGRGIALFYSTDHASNHNTSGIYLLEADSVEGPWIDRGRIYRDDVDGNQTETPSVIYDKTTNKLLMFYQQAATAGGIGSQQTLLATAETSDLTTWTRAGVVLDKELAAQDGEGHSGYFRPFKFCGETMGYSLYGGGNVSNASLWRSKDGGYTWCRDGSMIGYMQDKCKHLASILETPSHHCILTIYEGDVMIWNGQPWWIGVVGKAQAGSIPVRNSRLVAAPLSDDFTSLKCNVVDITPEKASYETVTGIDYPGNIFEFEGEYYSAYRTGGQKGAIGLMKLVNG